MTESRSSDRKLKPLPPDPASHQDSAIAPGFIDLDDLAHRLSSLIVCSFLIQEEAVNPESAKYSVRY
jgi:hypothetical protein